MASTSVGNLDVRLLPNGEQFLAAVGASSSTFGRPVEADAVSEFVGALHSARLRDFRPVVSGTTLDPNEAARRIGTQLFDAVFQKGTRDEIIAKWASADAAHELVRLRLQVSDVPELATFPWELLFRDPEHLVFGPHPYIARYGGASDRAEPKRIEAALRVLVVASLPRDLNQLDAAEESALVASRLGDLDLVELSELRQPTFDQLCERLEEGWHVVHYVGHGGVDPATGGFLALCDDDQRSAPLDARTLGRLLSPPTDVRLVVLNACRTAGGPSERPLNGVANELMVHGVPAVVAMQFPVSDEQALRFAEAFYRSVARHEIVDLAVSRGRKAV